MAQEQEPKKKPNKVLPIILGIILIGGIIFGIKEYIYYGKHIDTDDAQIDADVSPVVARVGGYVDSVFFEENGHVEKGQVLVKLDDRDYKIRVEQAMAAKQSASAGIGVGQSQIISTADLLLQAAAFLALAMVLFTHGSAAHADGACATSLRRYGGGGAGGRCASRAPPNALRRVP